MNRIILGGIDFTPSVEGIQDVTMEVGTTENRSAFSVSSDITFTEESYEFVRNHFWLNCDGVNQILYGTFIPDGCSLTIPIVIRSDSMTYLPHLCRIEANFTSETKEDQLVQKLQKTYLGDNGFDTAFEHPRVYYANQPGFIMAFLYFFRGLFFILMLSISFSINSIVVGINGILLAINGILKVIDFLTPGVDVPTIKLVEFIKPSKFFAKFDNFISGTGRYAITPLIREIYDHHCAVHGITFRSSIFKDTNSPYYNVGLFLLQNDRGVEQADDQNWQHQNEPFENILEILDMLKEPFNAEWILIENELIFERKDWFLDNLEIRYSVDLKKESTGYNHDATRMYGGWSGDYNRDQLDEMGNGMMNYGYSDAVEWNDPVSENQRGVKQVNVPFGPVRHSFDRTSLDASTKNFNNEFAMDIFRTGDYPLGGDLFAGFPGISKSFGTTSTDLVIIGNHTTQYMKLLALRLDLNRRDAKIIKKSIGFESTNNFGFQEFFDANYPLYIDEFAEDKELYQNFHYIDNPRTKENNRLITGQYEFELDCNMVDLLIRRAPITGIETPFGKARAQRWIIDFNRCKIIPQNIEILCNFGA